jgi:hypothetical protein
MKISKHVYILLKLHINIWLAAHNLLILVLIYVLQSERQTVSGIIRRKYGNGQVKNGLGWF